MPAETITVSGEVAFVTPWKSGKGSWVNLKNNPNDFFAFSGKVPNVGETGTWEVKEGTGHMADKVELVKAVKDLGLKEKIKVKAKAEVKEMEGLMDKGDKVYFDRQNLIVRQTCMKAAARIVAAIIARGDELSPAQATENAADVADKLYDWVTMQEPKLPEPPEEP